MRLLLSILLLGLLAACSGSEDEGTQFTLLKSSTTGIVFSNTIQEDASINVIDFQYCYNGGGVGIGDFNGDELPDIVFTGNQVSSRIYLNKGDMKFSDITDEAGLQTSSWVTGVSIVDINADGLDDIYLNVGGADCNNDCPNLLYINEGLSPENNLPRFTEQAEAYGLNEANYAQQTVFFDYDLDGDLDAYMLRNGNVAFDKNSPVPKRYYPNHLRDVLLENHSQDSLPHPYFVDVSEEKGITSKGFGLGLGINDFNNDGRIDLYIGNDFVTNDLLYLNHQSDSSVFFQESIDKLVKHQTYNSMGLDIADINNDALPDILVLDMLPQDYTRQKKMIGAMNYDKYELGLKNGYSPQFMRNTLQLNAGMLGDQVIPFQEISFQSKIAQTDWSWSPLLMDYDYDGDKDIFITNGYGKDITDLDFINYSKQNNVFGTDESRAAKLKELIEDLPQVDMPNYFFENKGRNQFEDVSSRWSAQPLSISNGAAYADLDRDGDLDLVINNINQQAFVLENKASDKEDFQFLNLQLRGPKENKHAIGAKIKIWQKGRVQTHFQSVIRGYLSSVEARASFGLPEAGLDSLIVHWPDGKVTRLTEVQTNQTLILEYQEAKEASTQLAPRDDLLFEESTTILDHVHQENVSNDYRSQPLLLRQASREGPCMVSSPDNTLLFIGGSHGEAGTVWTTDQGAGFSLKQKLDSIYEDSDAVFLDIDLDGDMDLVVSSGGSEHAQGSALYTDRIYKNNGQDLFKRNGALPFVEQQSSSCIRPFDFDQDGDMDLFVGSGIVPGKYPKRPDQHLLVNQNGQYVLAETEVFNELGMVRDARWEDLDQDGWADLILIGQWMEITVLKNDSGALKPQKIHLENEKGESILSSGLWNHIAAADFDQDGDVDLVLGNQGQNNFITASQQYPIYVYKEDFDGNTSQDPVVGAFFQTKAGIELRPMHSRDDIMRQLVSLKARYNTYEDFSKASFTELLQIEDLSESTLSCTIMESSYLENLGHFNFRLRVLPHEAQRGPVKSILARDFDQDGHLDLLMTGNDYSTETHYGRHDALNGLLLTGNSKGQFSPVATRNSGFLVAGQSNNLLEINNSAGEIFIIANQNNDKTKVFKLNSAKPD